MIIYTTVVVLFTTVQTVKVAQYSAKWLFDRSLTFVFLEVGYFLAPISAGHLSCRWMDVGNSVIYIWELSPAPGHLPSCCVSTIETHLSQIIYSLCYVN